MKCRIKSKWNAHRVFNNLKSMVGQKKISPYYRYSKLTSLYLYHIEQFTCGWTNLQPTVKSLCYYGCNYSFSCDKSPSHLLKKAISPEIIKSHARPGDKPSQKLLHFFGFVSLFFFFHCFRPRYR